MKRDYSRRHFLSRAFFGTAGLALAGTGTPGSWRAHGAAPAEKPAGPVTAKTLLGEMIYTRDEVRQWLAGEAFPFAKYSSEYGWLLRNGRFRDGVDNSISVYTYGPLDERITISYRDRACRINTYGNSFTQCHQVSDGETWQEFLAAHLQEPVRNFGVGGWSVYQAYLRMLREEQRVPAECMILNLYADDHFRNLDSWRNIRARKHVRFIEPTLPHVVVNEKEGLFEERPNPCPTPESFYNLCDLDWVVDRFQNDFVLQIMLAHRNAKGENPERGYADLLKLATTHGIVTRSDTSASLSEAAAAVHRQAAFFATRQIVDRIEKFAKNNEKQVLYVLSYPAQDIARFVETGSRVDQPIVDFLKERKLPYVDLLEAHVDEFGRYKGPLLDYASQYWIGHYSPRGNFFCAQAVKDKLTAMLDPKPLPYRKDDGVLE